VAVSAVEGGQYFPWSLCFARPLTHLLSSQFLRSLILSFPRLSRVLHVLTLHVCSSVASGSPGQDYTSRFPSISQFLCVSTTTLRGVEELLSCVVDEALRQTYMPEHIPKNVLGLEARVG
jgi:hypothetical protein